ncbi:MAG: hypothetical protein AB7O67_08810 [Vicinamibacterales bacterium]
MPRHPRMPKQSRSKPILPEVQAFIRFVFSRLVPGTSSGAGIWFSLRGEGSLFLDPEERKEYTATIAHLMATHVPKHDLSRRSVETFLQDALFEALDLQGKSNTSFDDRLQASLDRLLSRLEAKSQRFTCWIPIDGADLATLPAHFAEVRMAVFGHRQLRALRASREMSSAKGLAAITRDLHQSELWNRGCAIVPVHARDFAAAEALALHRTRQVLDLVNGFSDLIPYNYGWLYLPGDTVASKRMLPIRRDADATFTAHYSAIDPLTPFSWQKLRGERRLFRLFSTLSTLTRIATRGSCGALLVTAAQWIGRATVDRRREEAFLLFTIALETLFLPGEKSGEMAFRLKLRVAHLLGRTVAARAQVAEEMNRLYNIRSAIVHAGSYEVTDEDLGLVRAISKRALLKLLRLKSIHRLSHKDFSIWLDRRILRR